MYSRIPSTARSTGPVVILVAFTVIFAVTWNHDSPQVRSQRTDLVRRVPTTSVDQTAPPRAIQFPPAPDTASPANRASADSRLLTGLRSISVVCETPGRFAAGGTVGVQVRPQTLVADRKCFCFAGGAAFLCGTMADEETPVTATLDDEEDWALE